MWHCLDNKSAESRNTGFSPLSDNIAKNDVSVETLTGANYVSPAPITLMYQAGYLTIKDYDQRFNTYNLDYPNEEVKIPEFVKSSLCSGIGRRRTICLSIYTRH